MGTPLPKVVMTLLWDVDVSGIDLERNRDYVIERIMSRGGWDAMNWLRRAYPIETLRDFVQRRGDVLAPRERAYWALLTGVELPSAPGGGRPAWAGP